MKSHIKKTILCLSLTTLIGQATYAQSLSSDRLIGVTQRQLENSKSWLEWQHIGSLFEGQTEFIHDPYLNVWADRSSNRSYSRAKMEQLLTEKNTSIDRERMRLAIALDYLEEGRELLRSQGIHSRAVQQVYTSAANYLAKVNPIGLLGQEHTQWLVARGYVFMSLEKSNLKAAKALLTEATEHANPWGEKALLYLAMLEHTEGHTDVALRLIRGQQWSRTLAAEALYQEILFSQGHISPEQTLLEAQNATRRYPQLAHRPHLIGAMGIAYYKLRDWNNVLRTLEPIARNDSNSLIASELYALGATYYALGRYEEATTPLEQVATSSKGLLASTAQFALGNIYAHRGDYSQAKLAYTSVDAPQHSSIHQWISEESLYRLIELNFSDGLDAFGSQTAQIERFLRLYPKSTHRPRVLDLVRQYCHTSTNYQGTLELIKKLGYRDTQLSDVRQEVLVRYANSLGSHSTEYDKLLDEAIAIGSGRESYTIALLMRGQTELERKNYAEAERSLRLALAQQPWGNSYHSGIGHYLLGYTLYNQKKYTEALGSFQRYSSGQGSAELRADALARMGDCLLNQPKQHPEALKYYQEAIDLGTNNRDEAHRRIVYIYGLRGDYGAQVQEAERFVSTYPQSAYLPEVLYLKGKALSAEDRPGGKSEAHKIYKRVEDAYPSSPYASLSALERALLYASNGDSERAIPAYKHVVAQYPTSIEAKTALADLKTLYSELDRMDEYARYAEGIDRTTLPDDLNIEELNLLGLEARLRRGDTLAIDALKQWTERHTKSPRLYEAERLLAQSYIQQQRYTEATALLKQMEGRHTAHAQQLQIAELQIEGYKASSDTAAMLASYHKAYNLSMGNSQKRTQIALALSRAAYDAGAYQTALQVTTEELKAQSLGTSAKESLTLIKGKTQEQLKAIKGAIQTYQTLEGSYKSPEGAEAAVRRAELMLRLGQYAEVEELLEQFIASGTPQHYWLARGFIALSDSHAAQGEEYLAVQYLQNLQQTYTNAEEDIRTMITTRLNKLKK